MPFLGEVPINMQIRTSGDAGDPAASFEDPLVAPAHGERLQALIPDADLRWIEQSSHFAHIDTPDQVVTAVLPFLSGVRSAEVG